MSDAVADVLIVALVLAWAAILLLGLAVGALLTQVRQLQAEPRGQGGPAGPQTAVSWLAGPDGVRLPAPYTALFVSSSCTTCAGRVPAVLAGLAGAGTADVPLLLVSDLPVRAWEPLPAGVSWVIDPGAAERFGVPAFPWFLSVDPDGLAGETFPVGGPDDVDQVLAVVRAAAVAPDAARAGGLS